MSDTALRVCPSASRSQTKLSSGTVTRWPPALKGIPSMRVCPRSHAQRCLFTSTLVRSMPAGRCQSMIAASPCRSIAPPQAGQIIGAASAVTSSPGTVRTVTAVGHGFLYVPKSTTSRSSRGAPVCTNPSSCDGSTRKPESASPSPSSDATAV